MRAQLLGCYNADRRISMDVYALALKRGLQTNMVQADVITPEHHLERWPNSRMIMRYLRYFAYGRQIRSDAVDVQHVCDHGYAHLYSALKRATPKAKTVITIHDMIPFLTWKGIVPRPSGATKMERRPALNIHSLGFVKHFDQIVTVSQSTKQDVVEFLNVPPDQVAVVPAIIDDYFCTQPESNRRALHSELNLSESTKLIMISGNDHYKNLESSLQVLATLRQEKHDVAILKTGRPSTEFISQVHNLGLEKDVHCLFLESHTDLAKVYAGVDCLLFPSWYEGFGMPVAEALACGTPVVTSNRASLPEVGGALAKYADPNDIEALCEYVIMCMTDSDHQKNVYEQGQQWVSQFRPSVVGCEMAALYRH